MLAMPIRRLYTVSLLRQVKNQTVRPVSMCYVAKRRLYTVLLKTQADTQTVRQSDCHYVYLVHEVVVDNLVREVRTQYDSLTVSINSLPMRRL